jgi:hydroxymethylglutaryl-CoA synthase
MNRSGIVGYGTSVPRMRIKVGEIAKVWGKDGERVSSGLGIIEKSVPALDEDSATLAVEAARVAVEAGKINPQKIGAVFVGSESKPYAVKPTATVVAQAVGASVHMTAADLEFACKAGTAAIQACMGMVASGMIEYGLAIGSDTAQGKPGDALEYSAGGGAAAYVIGKPAESIAVIEDTYSFTTDTPDFWRRQHEEFPEHGGRFTAEPAYFKHVVSATRGLLEKTGMKIGDFDFVVFHQPNGKFPGRAAKILGVPDEKIKQGLITPILGNTYSASSMVGLASVLDVAKAGERILMTSYGSGAGSDSFWFTVTDKIEEEGRRQPESVFEMLKDKVNVDYATYAKHRRKIKSL